MSETRESVAIADVPPERASPLRRRRAALWAAAAVALAGLVWLGSRSGASQGKAGGGGPSGKGSGLPAIPVAVATAERRDVPMYLSGLGTVTAFNTVTVKTRVDGQIVQVAFREGQEVHRGDLLVEIDPRPFDVQLSQARANLARDQAQLADARLNLQRDQDLSKEGVLPQQQLDSQRALVQQNEGSVQADQATIDNARLQLTYSRITSPIDGRVGLRLVDVGNMVRAADSTGLVVITQLEPITVVFTLPEDSLPAVSQHMKGSPLPVEAWSRDDRAKLATGHLLTIDNQIDSSTGTGRLKAAFDNKDRALWPNQFVNARLLLETKKDQTVVPAAAVQRGSQGPFAYVVNAEHKVEVRQVKVGLTNAGLTAIDSGVKPGEQVITDGHEKVQAGSRVDVRAPSPAPSSAAPGAAS
jgi:membrane fusion protein, multidrug efflux system